MAVAKLRILQFCRVCQAPCSPCAYSIARSRRSAVPYTAWTRRRRRTGQLRGMNGSLLRSQSCDFHVLRGVPEIGRSIILSNCFVSCNKFSHLRQNKCSASGAPLNRVRHIYSPPGVQARPTTFDFWIGGPETLVL